MKPTVLLIDDDRQLLDLYAMKFSLDESCLLLTAATPEEGLQSAALARPDLILLDLILPKKEGIAPDLDKEAGFAVLRRLTTDASTKDIPVVVFTNLDETRGENVARAKALGARDYWVKAKLLPAEVLARVKTIIGQTEPRAGP